MENISYFRNILNNEIIRLEYLSEKWHENFLNGSVPEDESEIILSVIGQTKLLIKEKFKQFHDLIEMCEKNDPNEHKVTLGDLQGYWDVVSIEIDKINKDYNILEQKESTQWKIISEADTGTGTASQSTNITSSDAEFPKFNINECIADALNKKSNDL